MKESLQAMGSLEKNEKQHSKNSDWARDRTYIELAQALRDPNINPQQVLAEFERREREYVSISVQDYFKLTEAAKMLEAIRHLIQIWIKDRSGDDDCYMLAISEILNRTRPRRQVRPD
ncbi:MAG: hypothetical protein HYU64_09305 [Armatimonadetes bacterium]|nr:hypothetical protein [Armatimonadota bacterium]